MSRYPWRVVMSLVLLASMAIAYPGGAELIEQDGQFGLSVPEVGWIVWVPTRGYTLRRHPEMANHREAYALFAHATTGLNASLYLRPATVCRTAVACRDYYWQHRHSSMATAQGVTRFERNGFAFLEFLVPEISGQPIQQYHFSGHRVRDGYWIDLHLSKVLYTPKERLHFLDFVDAVVIQPKAR